MRLKVIGIKELMDDFNIPPADYEPKIINLKKKGRGKNEKNYNK